MGALKHAVIEIVEAILQHRAEQLVLKGEDVFDSDTSYQQLVSEALENPKAFAAKYWDLIPVPHRKIFGSQNDTSGS